MEGLSVKQCLPQAFWILGERESQAWLSKELIPKCWCQSKEGPVPPSLGRPLCLRNQICKWLPHLTLKPITNNSGEFVSTKSSYFGNNTFLSRYIFPASNGGWSIIYSLCFPQDNIHHYPCKPTSVFCHSHLPLEHLNVNSFWWVALWHSC